MKFKPQLFDHNKASSPRIMHDEPAAAKQLAAEIGKHMPLGISQRPIVFVCIGTDRSTGDSLGPLVGTLLKEKDISPFYVYGTLENPIHAVNLADQLSDIKRKHINPFIIGIDACLGRMKSVGVIQIGEGPVKPGAGVNKDLPEVGHMHITGIVNVSGFMEFFVLQNTRLHLVLNMAKTIASGIHEASRSIERKSLLTTLNWDLNEEQTT